jgi:hypothetical protein
MAEREKSAKNGAKPRAGEKAAAKPKPRAVAGRPTRSASGAKGKREAATKTGGPAKRASGGAREGAALRSRPAGPRGEARKAPRRKPTPLAEKPATTLSEEDQIRSAKYLPRDLPPRLFEEERFLFPETYGVNRVRLLVKDPDWLFAHWDVDPRSLEGMQKNLGERAMALSRLTLRVMDPANGGSSDILLPPGARGWYIRVDETRRSYKAQLGVTLPSGEFRRLAESNAVVTPRVGPARERAQRRITFGQAGRIPKDAGLALREKELRTTGSGAGPWQAASVDGLSPEAGAATGSAAGAKAASGPRRPARQGGASDVFRPGGASDVHRR